MPMRERDLSSSVSLAPGCSPWVSTGLWCCSHPHSTQHQTGFLRKQSHHVMYQFYSLQRLSLAQRESAIHTPFWATSLHALAPPASLSSPPTTPLPLSHPHPPSLSLTGATGSPGHTRPRAAWSLLHHCALNPGTKPGSIHGF